MLHISSYFTYDPAFLARNCLFDTSLQLSTALHGLLDGGGLSETYRDFGEAQHRTVVKTEVMVCFVTAMDWPEQPEEKIKSKHPNFP